MKLVGGIIVHFVANMVAILAADHFLPGFSFRGTFIDLAITAAVLTAINTFLKPILKLFLGPFIVLTFGLFTVVINAFTLYLLDIVSLPLTMDGYVTLLYATLLTSAVNIIVASGAKLTSRN